MFSSFTDLCVSFVRKMASKKIYVNLSGPRTLKGGSSKNIGE